METPTYDVDHFIERINKIPEDKIIKEILFKSSDPTKRCIQGHVMPFNTAGELIAATNGHKGESFVSFAKDYPEWNALNHLFGITKQNGNDFPVIAQVNNGEHPGYKQATPKQRLLAALADWKETGKLKQE